MTDRDGRETTLGAACVLGGATAIQSSAAIGVPCFAVIGAAATSGLRFLFGAVVLATVARPSLRGRTRAGWLGIAAFGIAVAAMNLCFFQAVARLPLGTAVSIEFLGPFTLAVVTGSGRRHGVFAALGLVGVVLLARPGGGVTLVGALFALGAAAGWASYTLASQRLGAVTEGIDGLALAICIAAVLTVGFSIPALTSLTWSLLARLVSMAVLGVVIGFSLELAALRRLAAAHVAVLFSLNPAIAFGIGWLVLGQHVQLTALAGGLCVVGAGIAVTSDARRQEITLPPA
ncbi:MAG TPA: EamA family transporter [Acidimicrobiales bacterium]|nr:EamA family transporter [Acidimicrobiales bacterium]